MLYTERIKALRSDHDLNQTQVANAIHVAQTTYGLTINRFRADCGSCSEEIVEEIEKHSKSFYW